MEYTCPQCNQDCQKLNGKLEEGCTMEDLKKVRWFCDSCFTKKQKELNVQEDR